MSVKLITKALFSRTDISENSEKKSHNYVRVSGEETSFRFVDLMVSII
jgi:hypothetical protein